MLQDIAQWAIKILLPLALPFIEKEVQKEIEALFGKIGSWAAKQQNATVAAHKITLQLHAALQE